jgi:hypothetical protein
MRPQNILIIFARYPQRGRVKTRLAKSIGDSNAAYLYREFVEAVILRTKDRTYRRIIFFSPVSRRKDFINWLGADIQNYPQRGNNLGRRLSHAFELAFKKGAKRVVVIGTDSPLIDRNIVRKAFNKLKTSQCVIGPSFDGGYYLIGLSGFYRDLFKGIDWSTNRVLKQTLTRVGQLDIKCAILPKHFDVDAHKDLFILKKEILKAENSNSKGLFSLKGVLDAVIC